MNYSFERRRKEGQVRGESVKAGETPARQIHQRLHGGPQG